MHVAAPRRRGDGEARPAIIDREAERTQRSADRCVVEREAEQPCDVALRQRDRLDRRRFVAVRARRANASAFGGEQGCRTGRSAVGQRDRQILLVAGRRFGAQSERDAHAADSRTGPIRALDGDLARRWADLTDEPAHHPGEPGRLALVGDQERGRAERALAAVEGGERFVGPRIAHDDVRARDLLVVEEM